MRFRVIGDRTRLPPDIVTLIDNAEALTRENARLDLPIALSYGGRAEIAQAARRIADEVKAGRLGLDAVDEACFGRHLLTGGIPDPDLLIRTSGEQRISNFLLVAKRLCRAGLHRHAVARFRQRAISKRAARLSRPRTALRRFRWLALSDGVVA